MKRTVDCFLAGLAAIILAPLLIPVMILLKLTGEKEVFYVQSRIGLNNCKFGILKFATMLKDSPQLATRSITLPNDPRVLPVGRLLRKTKINELPQIFNVLKGDMSIVGPRPLAQETFDAYSKPIQAEIYDCKPGLTGIGSIIFRDEEALFQKSDLEPKEFYRKQIAPYKGTVELWYKENRSTWKDFVIIFLTAWVIVFPDSQLPHRLFYDLPKFSDDSVEQHTDCSLDIDTLNETPDEITSAPAVQHDSRPKAAA